MRYHLFDVVTLTADFPDLGLEAGSSGTVVDVYTAPIEAYEVEFCDDQGRTKVLRAFLPEHLALADENYTKE